MFEFFSYYQLDDVIFEITKTIIAAQTSILNSVQLLEELVSICTLARKMTSFCQSCMIITYSTFKVAL